MSDVFERGISWHTFLGLENDLIDITRYVALTLDNSSTWSEKIAQLLLLTGSTVDSVFYEMRSSSLLPQTAQVLELARKNQPSIDDYREVYEPLFQLSNVEVEARHGLADYGTIKPFEGFSKNESPVWWRAYNEVKHEFFQNIWKGTLHHLVLAPGGLFVLNVLHKDSQQYLLKKGLIQMGDFDKRFVYWHDYMRGWDALKNSFIGLHGDVSWDAWTTSEIFLHRFRHDRHAKS
jgi:hypothetical protein